MANQVDVERVMKYFGVNRKTAETMVQRGVKLSTGCSQCQKK